MTTLEHDGYKIDETAQICLRVLRDRRESVTTGELREAAGVEQNAQIRYRMDEYLIPSNLVERAADKEAPGKGPEAAAWRLTDEGVEWVDEYEGEVETAVDGARVVESLQRTREVVDRLDQRVDEQDDRLDEFEEMIEKIQERVHRSEGKADSAVQAGDDAVNRMYEIQGEIDEDVEEVREQLDDLGGRLVEVEDVVEGQDERMEAVVEQVNDSFDSMDERIARLDESVREVRKRQETSLFARLRSWYRR